MKTLLNLGLAIIPFLILPGYDSREPKMALALMVALALGLWGFYQGKLKPFKNIWILLFLIYLPISWFFSPKPSIQLFNIEVQNFWAWKSILYTFIFSLYFIAISGLEFSDDDKNKMLKVMCWVGFIMALYCIFQGFRIEQWFAPNIEKNIGEVIHTPQSNIGGTLGNPTIVASFMVMIIPLCLYLRRYLFAIIIGLAVILTKSYVAIGAMVAICLFLGACRGRRWAIAIGIGILAISLVFGLGMARNAKFKANILNMGSGRFTVWKEAIQDMKPRPDKEGPGIPYTGFVMGSFYFTYHVKHNNAFFQAHNELVELLYNTGIIGLLLFLAGIWYMIKVNLKSLDRYRKYLLASFVSIAVCACGVFNFQLGAHIFYILTICGLLHNQNKEEV